MLNQQTEQGTPNCPICDCGSFTPSRLGLVVCNQCNLILSPQIWKPDTNVLLEEEWFGEDYQIQSSYWVRLFEEWNNNRTLSRIGKDKPGAKRLLEIGVGSGSFLVKAREHAYEVMGCDLSESICNRVRRGHGISMYCGQIANFRDVIGFDVIVMNHVLEHVHRPVEFMNEVRRLLRPGGIVHLIVPNVCCWEASLSGWTSYEPYHLTYFDPKAVRSTFSKANLLVEELTTHESFSGWFLAVIRSVIGVNSLHGAVMRDSASSIGHSTGRRNPLVEHIYRLSMVACGALLSPIRALQARMEYGDEIVCIGKKSLAASETPEFA